MIKDNRIIDRFNSYIIKYPEGCWVWKGCRSKSYGRMKVNGVMIQAHRLSYEIYKGDIPTNSDILHICDNKSCVNPDHLYLGNRSLNMKDYINRHTWKSPNKRFSDADYENVRNLRCQGLSYSAIADTVGCSKTHIMRIINGRRD